jgi:hypothetical protein
MNYWQYATNHVFIGLPLTGGRGPMGLFFKPTQYPATASSSCVDGLLSRLNPHGVSQTI